MDRTTVFVKTAKGEEEIRTRQHQLPPATRVALILVDGRSTTEELVSKGGGQTQFAESLAYLEQQGFIVASGGTAVRAASAPPASPAAPSRPGGAALKPQLVQLVQSLVSRGADKVVAKLSEAPDSRDGLEAAVVACHKLMRLTIDEKKAEEFLAKAKEILGAGG